MIRELNTEQKQRINLTLSALQIINGDREQFAPHLTNSGFLNELLFRFAPQADASITDAVERQRQRILSSLEKKKLSQETLDTVTEALLEPFRRELILKASGHQKGSSLIFRLNNQNRDLFYSQDWPDAKYYDNTPSKYMKALLEEYASHTMYQREAFYFQEWITLAEAAAAAGRLLRITSVNAKGEKVVWDMRVYGILPNDAGLFHYIVGRSVLKGGLKSGERIASFRISRIVDMRILSAAGIRSGSLSKAERKEISEKIAHDHVQFLVGEREECVVRLTEKGKRMYRQIQYMKPLASFIDEEGCLHFDCSSFQILQYFYRFGEHACILEPASLREVFYDEYKRAYEAYLKICADKETSLSEDLCWQGNKPI